MGQEENKCCCKAKTKQEVEFLSSEDHSNSETENKICKIKQGKNFKDLKSYISFKNMESISQKDDESHSLNDNDININKDNIFPSNNNEKNNSTDNKYSKYKFNNNQKNNRISFNKNKEINPSYIIKIQKIYKGYNYRKFKYPKIKIELKRKLIYQLKTLYNQYLTPNLKKQEKSMGIIHNENSYKSLLSESKIIELNSPFQKQFHLYTKLYILKYNDINGFYIGEIDLENNLNGKGILTLSDGTKYIGNFKDNKFHGKGQLINKEGTLFEGNFKEGNLEGNATEKNLNGDIYIGDYVKGKKEGKGKEETKEQIYEGEYINNIKEGYGKVYYKLLNDNYEGEFKNNQINGKGIYKWNDGDVYKGDFLNGKMNGNGIYEWPNGRTYEGEYINGIKEGKGIFKWSNGKIFDGYFKNGNPDGNGILKYNNKIYKVFYKKGIIKNKVKVNKKDNNNSDIE